MKKFLGLLKKYIFFFIHIWDFKFDFPIPPKPFYRIFKPKFWNQMVNLYYRRKIFEKKYADGIKRYWEEEDFTQDNYLIWLYKSFNKQYNTVLNPIIFNKIKANNPSKLFELGSGSGNTSAIILSDIISDKMLDKFDKRIDYNLEYVGVDLSEVRSRKAMNMLPILFNKFMNNLSLDFYSADASNLKYADNYFDYSIAISVFERVDHKSIDSLVGELCRVTKSGIFISDTIDHYPHGFPRNEKKLNIIFQKYNFELKYHNYYTMTDTTRDKIGWEYCFIHYYFERIS
jgi:ubiquinone/menaquinone biosynthesis C-methylase UbiE